MSISIPFKFFYCAIRQKINEMKIDFDSPLFLFSSRDNKIVIEYKKEQMLDYE